MTTDEAVKVAIAECIRDGVLKEFLEKNRTEAYSMSIYEYDEKKHVQMEREEAKEETILNLVRKGLLSIKDAATELKLSVEELEKKL